LPALAIPGFVGGALFSVVLGIAGRRHTFHELSVARFAAWGAVGGLLLIVFPFALVAVGLASMEGGRFDAWHIISVISGPFILLSAASAVGSLLLARRSESRGSLRATDQARASLPDGAAEELIRQRHEALRGRPIPTSETETDRRA
jgi:hypothetical protein